MLYLHAKMFIFLLCVLIIGINGKAHAQQAEYLPPVPLSAINTTSDDYAPYWSKELSTLFFTTEQGGKAHTVQVRRSEHQWGEVKDYALPATQLKGMTSFFSIHGAIGYFSAFKMTSYRPQLSIFTIAREADSWSVPVELPAIVSDFFTAQSTISPDGTTLVFVSDRPGSIGKTDLWITSRTPNGTWEQPLNLGEFINSVGSEITPFLASEDSLFFASDGFGGKGGFDIYVSVRIGGIWQNPFPLSDINTEFNESDCIVLPSGDILLASDRIGSKGGLDLFYIAKKAEDTPTVPIEYALDIKPSMLTVEEYPVQELIFLPKFLPLDVLHYMTDSASDGQQPVASAAPDMSSPIAAFRSLSKIIARGGTNSAQDIYIRLVKNSSDSTVQVPLAEKMIARFIENMKMIVPTARFILLPTTETQQGLSGIALQYSSDKSENFISENSSLIQAKSDSVEFFLSVRPLRFAKPVTLLLLSPLLDTLSVAVADTFPFRLTVPTAKLFRFAQSSNSIECKVINTMGEEVVSTELPVQYISLRQKETQGIKEQAFARFTVFHQQSTTLELPETVIRAFSRYAIKNIHLYAADCSLAEQYSTMLQIRLQTVTKQLGQIMLSCGHTMFPSTTIMQVLTVPK